MMRSNLTMDTLHSHQHQLSLFLCLSLSWSIFTELLSKCFLLQKLVLLLFCLLQLCLHAVDGISALKDENICTIGLIYTLGYKM